MTAHPFAVAVSPQRLRDVCGASPGNACRWVLERSGNSVLARLADVAATRLLAIVVIWVFAFVVNRLVRLAIRRVVRHVEGVAASDRLQRVRERTPLLGVEPAGGARSRAAARARTTVVVLRSLSSAIVYGLAVIYSFSAIGVQLAPLLAGAGVAGVALGFGAQSLVRDFLSGLFMLVEDQLGVGDVVDVATTVGGAGPGVVGTVEAVTLRVTVIRDAEGTIWHVPNGQINRVGNHSQGVPPERSPSPSSPSPAVDEPADPDDESR